IDALQHPPGNARVGRYLYRVIQQAGLIGRPVDDGHRRRAAIGRVDRAQESFEAPVSQIDGHGYPNRPSCGGFRSGAAATPGRLIKWRARRVATPRFFRVSRIMCWKRRVLMELSGPVFLFACRLPPDEQEASYLAASARMESLSITEVMGHLLLCAYTVYRSGSSGPEGLRGQLRAGRQINCRSDAIAASPVAGTGGILRLAQRTRGRQGHEQDRAYARWHAQRGGFIGQHAGGGLPLPGAVR